jgi:NADP-dependent 3-hydroxy acid dehydrogenase YdfG
MPIKKVALVAGITFDTGGSILSRLLHDNFTVIVPVKSAHEIKWLKAISSLAGSGSLVTLIADYVDYYRAEEIFKDIHERYSEISLCVLYIEPLKINAPLTETSITNWEKMIEFNITGYFVIVRLMFGYMEKSKQGTLITISNDLNAEKGSQYKLDELSETMQKEMAEMFFQEIKDSGIDYKHVFIKSNKKTGIDTDKNFPDKFSNFIFDLYNGNSENQGSLFQWM